MFNPIVEALTRAGGGAVPAGDRTPVAVAMGPGTIYGLNVDGSPDGQDNGRTFAGDNSRDTEFRGVAIPRSAARQYFGSEQAAMGKTARVTNLDTGLVTEAPIREIGPAERTGNVVDLSYALTREVGGTGKNTMRVELYDALTDGNGSGGQVSGGGARVNPLVDALEAQRRSEVAAARAEAAAPRETLPVLNPALADALGVMDYRDVEEGARRRKANVVADLLNVPGLSAGPVNNDGTVTVRRAHALDPVIEAAGADEAKRLMTAATKERYVPGRLAEAGNRFVREARTGTEDVRQGAYSLVENYFKPFVNPYIGAKKNIPAEELPVLREELARLEKARTEYQDKEGAGRGMQSMISPVGSMVASTVSPYDKQIEDLKLRIPMAEAAVAGRPGEQDFRGSLSQAAGELADEARVAKQGIRAEYGKDRIRPERDKEFWMTVAGSLGGSAPSTGAAMLNPALGLSMMYAQTYAQAQDEYDASALAAGKNVDVAAREEYANKQAMLQTPWEIVGDLATAGVAKAAFKGAGGALVNAFRKGDTKAVTGWVAQELPKRFMQLGEAASGETLVTTPAQTVIDQKVAEGAGVRNKISNSDLAANTWDAMKVAGAQSLIMAGGPVAIEAGVSKVGSRKADGGSAVERGGSGASSSEGVPVSSPAGMASVRAPVISVDPAAEAAAFGKSVPAESETGDAGGSNEIAGGGIAAGALPGAAGALPSVEVGMRNADGGSSIPSPAGVSADELLDGKTLKGGGQNGEANQEGLLQGQGRREEVLSPDQITPAGNTGGSVAPESGKVVKLTGEEFGKDQSIPVLREAAFQKLHSLRGTWVEDSIGNPILFDRKSERKPISGNRRVEELQALAGIEDLIHRADYVGEFVDREKDPNIKAWHKYEAPVEISGNDYSVTIQVRELKDGKRFYDSYILNEMKPVTKAGTASETLSVPTSVVAGSTDNKQSSSENVKPDQNAVPVSESPGGMKKPTGNPEGGFVVADVPQAIVDFGRSIYQHGMDFAEWSGRMIKELGESARVHLEKLWKAIKEHFTYINKGAVTGGIGNRAGEVSKPRKFAESVKAAEGVASEVKDRMTALEYDPVSNPETLAAARARMDAAGSMDAAVAQVMDVGANGSPTAVDYAMGIELMGQLQARGRHADAAAIADTMAKRATDQGRAIQALSMISRLTPAGIEVFVRRQLRRVVEAHPETKRLFEENERLRTELDKVRHGAGTAAIVGHQDTINTALPAGVNAVAVNMAIREAILQSPTPTGAQAAVAKILRDNGVTEKGSLRIAGAILKDFLTTSKDARAEVLRGLHAAAEADRRLDKSRLGALMRMNRDGSLTDERLYEAVASMLGVPHWSQANAEKVRKLLLERERATDPRIKLVKAAEALDVVYRESFPPGILAKIDTFQTLCMLLNPKTWIRNVVGNVMMFGADLAADGVAVVPDAAVSVFTGKRTRTGLDVAQRFAGLGAGLDDVRAGYGFARDSGLGRIGSLKAGVETLVRMGRLMSSGKWDSTSLTGYTGTTFTNPVMAGLENTLGAALSLADRGFYESAFRGSLRNQMRSVAKSGSPVAAPTPDMIVQARMDAGRAIYQDENVASRTMGGLRKVLNLGKRWGLGSLMLKFTQVPGSILMRGVEFSPLGFIRAAYEGVAPLLVKGKDFNQKAFVEAFSRAVSGSAGLVGLGWWLAYIGVASAGADQEDEEARALAKASGWGAYKLNVSALKRALMTGNFWTKQKPVPGDVVVNYDWAQPLSISLAMGVEARENELGAKRKEMMGKRSALENGLNWMNAAAGAATGAMDALVEQPLLQGLNKFFQQATYGNIPGAIAATAAEAPKSMVPSAVRQWMQLGDNYVREQRDGTSAYREVVNGYKAMLPGTSRELPVKRDILGSDVERYQYGTNTIFNVLFNPAMVTYIKQSRPLSEMTEVYRMTGSRGAVPDAVKPEFTLDGVKVRLTAEEISALQKDMGALSVAAVEKYVLDDPRYRTATWDQKAKAMTRALEKASQVAKMRTLRSKPDLADRAMREHVAGLQARAEAQQALAEE